MDKGLLSLCVHCSRKVRYRDHLVFGLILGKNERVKSHPEDILCVIALETL